MDLSSPVLSVIDIDAKAIHPHQELGAFLVCDVIVGDAIGLQVLAHLIAPVINIANMEAVALCKHESLP